MTKKKTFLFITDTNYKDGELTGGHKRFLELVKSVGRKNDVVLVSGEIPQLKNERIKYIGINGKTSFLPAHINRIIAISKVLRRERKNIRYDYAISFGPADTVCYKKSGYKNIVTLFREDFVGYKKIVGVSGVKLWYFKMLEKCAVKNSEKLIVQCEDDKNALVDRYGDSVKSKIFVQINNVNASWITENKTQKKKNSDGVTRIAFIGNFADERKGQGILFPAVKKLIDDGYKIKLYVAGDGKLLEKYKEEYEDYNDIVFLGRVENVGGLLAESDFEVVPSLMDSCPNTVLEGLNAGIAVYGTNVGGIKEILKDKDYLFESNVNSLYVFIKNIVSNKKFIDDAGDQEIIKRRLTFDWGERIEQIITSNKKNENILEVKTNKNYERIKRPFITVITPVYNRRGTMRRVIESVDAQTFRNIEYLVIDDGSTECIDDIMRDFMRSTDLPVMFIKKQNGGVHTARNEGYRRARGEMVLCIDSDDELTQDACRIFYDTWKSIPGSKEGIQQIKAQCIDQNGNAGGVMFPDNINKLPNGEARKYFMTKGERIGCHVTKIMQENLYPEPEGVTVVSESVRLVELEQKYKTWGINEAVRIWHRGGNDHLSKKWCGEKQHARNMLWSRVYMLNRRKIFYPSFSKYLVNLAKYSVFRQNLLKYGNVEFVNNNKLEGFWNNFWRMIFRIPAKIYLFFEIKKRNKAINGEETGENEGCK